MVPVFFIHTPRRAQGHEEQQGQRGDQGHRR